MVDHKSVLGGLASGFNIMVGVITLNNLAIIVGILSGLSVIAYNVINSVLKIKEYKKNVNRPNS